MLGWIKWLEANGWALALILVWDVSLKLLGMWRAAKENQKVWFVLLMIVNSVGLLPLIYLVFIAKEKIWMKKEVSVIQEAEVVKKRRK